jgi:O-antigen/teichoic acid export membrane protein
MLISTPFLLSSMGAKNYGLWNLGLAFLGLIGIADVGIGAATIKYIAEFNENNDIQSLSEIITTSFAITILLGVFFTTILFLLSPWFASFFTDIRNRDTDILLIFQICILGLFPVILENIGLAIPRGFQDYKTTTILLISQNIFTILLAVWVVIKNGTIVQIISGTVIIVWCFAISSLVIAFRKARRIGFYITFSLNALRNLTRFMLFMGVTGIGIKIFTLFDRIVVAQTLGLEASAYYSIATGVANKFTALGSAATQALFPAFSSWNVNNNKQSIWKKLVTATLLIGIGAIVPGMILLCFSQPLVFWWLGKENGSAVLLPMQILIFIYMIKTITAPSYQAANGLGFPWITTLAIMIASLGTIGLIIVLGKIYGLNGAAWANIASWSLFIIVFYLYKTLKHQKVDVGL